MIGRLRHVWCVSRETCEGSEPSRFRGTANRHPANLSLIWTPQRHRRHPLAMFHVKHHPGNPKQPKGSSIASDITSPKPRLHLPPPRIARQREQHVRRGSTMRTAPPSSARHVTPALCRLTPIASRGTHVRCDTRDVSRETPTVGLRCEPPEPRRGARSRFTESHGVVSTHSRLSPGDGPQPFVSPPNAKPRRRLLDEAR